MLLCPPNADLAWKKIAAEEIAGMSALSQAGAGEHNFKNSFKGGIFTCFFRVLYLGIMRKCGVG